MVVAYGRTPLAGAYVLDTLYYRTWALRIAAGGRPETGVFEQSPLYAYLLGGVFRWFGPAELSAIALQMLCGTLTVVLLYDAARRLFGTRSALATGLLAAVYGPLLLHECLLMKSFLEPLFVSAALWAVVRHREEQRARWAAIAGLALGLAVLVREVHAILLVPAAFALVRRRRSVAVGSRLADVAVLALVFVTVILPVSARNYALSGGLTFVTAAGGENLYLAYGPEAGAYYTVPPFVTAAPHREHEAFREEASLRVGRPMNRGDASEFWYREALHSLQARPARAAGLALRKVQALFQDFEAPDSEDYFVAREYLPFLWVLPTFGWIFGLGLLGIAIPARGHRGAPLVWFIAFLVIEVVLTFNLARYRLAMTALWLIPSGAGAVWLLDALRDRGSRAVRAAAACVFVAAATAFSLLPPPAAVSVQRLREVERARLVKVADRKAVLPAMSAAAAAEPWNPERQMELGSVLRNLGRIPEGMAAYESILRANPAHAAARWELASTLVEEGRLDEAIEQLRVLTVNAPANVGAHYFLGRFLARNAARSEAQLAQRYEQEAWEHLQEALRLDLAHAPSLYEIGRLLYLRGDTRGALEALNRSLKAAPGFGEAEHLLEIIRTMHR